MKKTLQLLFLLIFPFIAMSQTTIFTENCGNPASTTSAATYTGWQNNGVLTYSATATYPDVRTTTPSSGYTGSSGSGNIYFNATSVIGTSGNINVTLSNINTSNYTNIVLSFGFLKTNNAWSNEVVVEVSSNGTSWTSLSFTPSTGTGTASVWYQLTASGAIPSTSNLRIRFRYASTSSTNTARFDDIKLVGCLIPSVPTPTYTNPSCTTAIISLPSNSYLETTATGTLTNISTSINTSGTYYARTVSVVAGCTSVWSAANTFSVTINTMPSITINPSNTTAYSVLKTYFFNAHASSSSIWQISTNSGSTWSNLTIVSPYYTNGDSLFIYPVSRTMNNYQYRISSTNGACIAYSVSASLSTSATLPVKLIDFEGYNQGAINKLKWVTASEIDNDRFEIERTDSSLIWKQMGIVNGNGTTDNKSEYSIIDYSPICGMSYYRLKQIDFDGNYEYSNIISINNDKTPDITYYDYLGRTVEQILPNRIYIRVTNNLYEKILLTN